MVYTYTIERDFFKNMNNNRNHKLNKNYLRVVMTPVFVLSVVVIYGASSKLLFNRDFFSKYS